jgi:hypothetical protein
MKSLAKDLPDGAQADDHKAQIFVDPQEIPGGIPAKNAQEAEVESSEDNQDQRREVDYPHRGGIRSSETRRTNYLIPKLSTTPPWTFVGRRAS